MLVCALLASVLAAGGCGPPPKRLSPREYFDQATDAFHQERFGTAVEKYGFLLDQYPLNPFAEEAQLKVAYAQFLEQSYAEAVGAFDDFERMYPLSPHLAFVTYYRAMCYAKQMRTVDRDQGVTEKALQYFREVVERYPQSPFAALAREKIQGCREALAAHELYVADFYVDWYNAPAAVSRMRGLLQNYRDTKACPLALVRLEDGFRKAGREEVASLARKAQEYLDGNRELASADAAPKSAGNPTPAPADEAQTPLALLIAELEKIEVQSSGVASAPEDAKGEGGGSGEAGAVVDREALAR